jgi:hypothetical protein
MKTAIRFHRTGLGRVILLAAWIAELTTLPAAAHTFVLKDQGVTLTAPDSWKEVIPLTGNNVLELRSPDMVALLAVYAVPVNPMPAWGSATEDQQLIQFLLQGQPWTGHGHVTLGGVDFLGIDAQGLVANHGGMFFSRMYATYVNNYLLSVSGAVTDKELPQNNPDLMAIFNSLTFNGQPVLPPKAAGK